MDFEAQWYNKDGNVGHIVDIEDGLGIEPLIDEFKLNNFIGCMISNVNTGESWNGYIIPGPDVLVRNDLRSYIRVSPDAMAYYLGVVIYQSDGYTHSVYCAENIDNAIHMLYDKMECIVKSSHIEKEYKKLTKHEYDRKNTYKAWFLNGEQVTSKYFLMHRPLQNANDSMSLHIGYNVNAFDYKPPHLIVRFYSKESAIKEYKELWKPENKLDPQSIVPSSCLYNNYSAVFDFQFLPCKESYTVVHHTTLGDLIELIDVWVDGLLYDRSTPTGENFK
jgi:hypothetical protein